MTKQTKAFVILGVGLGAIGWYWWRHSRGLSLIPNPLGSGGAIGAGSAVPTVGGNISVDNPDIVKARNEVTGSLARHSCQAGLTDMTHCCRWINTTTGPYYGHCVGNDVFALWAQLPGDVQQYATEATYLAFLRSIGRA